MGWNHFGFIHCSTTTHRPIEPQSSINRNSHKVGGVIHCSQKRHPDGGPRRVGIELISTANKSIATTPSLLGDFGVGADCDYAEICATATELMHLLTAVSDPILP